MGRMKRCWHKWDTVSRIIFISPRNLFLDMQARPIAVMGLSGVIQYYCETEAILLIWVEIG